MADSNSVGGNASLKSILKIPVDTSEWDRFIDSYQNYNKLLEQQGDAWANSNKGIRQQKTAFDDVDKTFSDLVNKAQNPHFSGPNGSFVKVTKSSKETEKSWRNIARDLEKSAKSMTGLARNGLNFSSLGMFGGVAGAAGAAAGGLFAGVRSADDDLANQNILNRKLDLKPGEEQAFDITHKQAGGDSALLAKVAAAKADPSQWRYLQAAGISIDDIKSKGTTELTEELMKKIGGKVRQLGPQQFGMWAHSQGVDKFGDTNTLRQMGSYSDAEYDQMHRKAQQLTPQLAADQKKYDEATAARAKIEADLARDGLALDLVFIKLNKPITDAADAFANWATKLSSSGELDQDVKAITTAFDALGTAAGKLEDALDWLADAEKPAADQQNQMGKAAMDFYKDAKAGNWAKAWADLNRPITNEPEKTATTGNQPAGTSPSMDALLDATKEVESHGKANAVGPVTKEGWQAQGPYQMSPADQKRYGVNNPFNEAEERAGARRKYADLQKKYGGNLHEVEAAYGWGEGHVDKYVKAHHGQFDEADLPDSVKDYLSKMDKAQQKQAQAFATANKTDLATPAPKAQTVKADTPQIVPMDSVDKAAIAAQQAEYQRVLHESFLDRMTRAARMAGNAIDNGSGSFMRDDGVTQKRIDRQGNQPMTPYKIDVHVSTPPGMSTTITAGGIAQ